MELFGLTTAELQQLAQDLGEPSYRGKQLAEWIYRKGIDNFSVMSNLSSGFREKLEENATVTRSRVSARRVSRDDTAKFLLDLADGNRIESVLLPYEDRVTVCVSSQVGCSVKCSFCATGDGGLVRSLSAGEIVDQVMTLQREGSRRVTNVVYMGMGEPLFNYDAVLKSVRVLNDEVGIAMRKITISTVGVIPSISKLKAENLQLTLAISLHAPDDELRRRLIPLADRYPMEKLLPICKDYAEKTGRRVTYEYMLINGVNDRPEQAEKLVKLLRRSLSSVNLIPYNEIKGKRFRRPPAASVDAFRKILEDAGIEVTQRFERGDTVSAACGQLRANQEPDD